MNKIPLDTHKYTCAHGCTYKSYIYIYIYIYVLTHIHEHTAIFFKSLTHTHKYTDTGRGKDTQSILYQENSRSAYMSVCECEIDR